ncbi:phage tail protein [Achromobacter insuavis]|uniref:phage tail protein n=1 Tax=Achromobacter insuavis TaxID=1287735 RepID=UPI001F140D79|nr:phage tail protein [Achromobacter insuavis]
MMMALGMFIFGLPTAAYQTLKRQNEWRHPSNSRMGAGPAYQFVGKGEDTITLTGTIIPQLFGTTSAIRLLRRMGDTGKAYVMVDGMGTVYGAFIITGLDAEDSMFFVNGLPQKSDFTITLKCVDDSQARPLLDDLQIPIDKMDGSIAGWGL